MWFCSQETLSIQESQGLSSWFHHERVWPQHQHRCSLQVLPNVRRLTVEMIHCSESSHCLALLIVISFCRSHSTQAHLKNVYASLAVCMFVAAAGAYVHVVTGLFQVRLKITPGLPVQDDAFLRPMQMVPFIKAQTTAFPPNLSDLICDLRYVTWWLKLFIVGKWAFSRVRSCETGRSIICLVFVWGRSLVAQIPDLSISMNDLVSKRVHIHMLLFCEG